MLAYRHVPRSGREPLPEAEVPDAIAGEILEANNDLDARRREYVGSLQIEARAGRPEPRRRWGIV